MARTPKASPHQKAKMEKTMGEFAKGSLRGGAGKHPIVTDRKQAIAIGLSQAGLSRAAKQSKAHGSGPFTGGELEKGYKSLDGKSKTVPMKLHGSGPFTEEELRQGYKLISGPVKVAGVIQQPHESEMRKEAVQQHSMPEHSPESEVENPKGMKLPRHKREAYSGGGEAKEEETL